MVVSSILESEAARQTAEWQRDPLRRYCRWLVLFFITVCDIDIKEPAQNSKLHPENPGLATKCWRKLTQSNPVSSLIRLIYTIVMCWFLVYTYYQTAYDVQLLRLERLRTLDNATAARLSKARAIAESLDYYDRILDAIGSPYKRANHFTATGAALVVAMLSFIIYDLAALYLYFNRSRIDSYLMNMFRDAHCETSNCAQLIKGEIASVLKSQANYLSLQKAKRLGPLGRPGSQLVPDLRAHLELWARRGALWPANHSADWVRRMSRDFLVYCLAVLAFFYGFNFTAFLIMPLALDLLVVRSHQDWLALFGWQYLDLLLDSSAAFYMTAFFLKCRDQANYLSVTHNQMIDCMRAIKQSSNKLLAAKRQLAMGRTNSLARLELGLVQRMNRELALALLRYRILLAYLKPDQALFKFAAFGAFLTPLWPPLVIRLLSAYGYEAARLFGIMFCLLCIAASICMLVPMCSHSHMGGRFYKTLFALEAQISQVVKQLSEQARGRLDGHIISLINREIAHPDLMLDKFAVKLLKYPITYPNMIRSHFWIILLLVSCLFDTQMLQTLLASRSSDPFGIYADLNQ